MRSISLASSVLIAAVQYGTAQAASQTQSIGVEQPSAAPVLNNQVVQGCFSSAGSLVFNSTQLYNSLSKCAHDICYMMGKKVAGTTAGNQCYCGDTYPPKADVVDDSNCNVGCTGYNLNACGGVGFWTIYNTGIDLSVTYDDGDGASASASPTAVVTVSGSVVVVTQTSNAGSGGGSANTAGIAAGVVVAVVAVAGIIGAFFFVLRRRRNREIEDEHRRNAAVNAFMNGQKPPSSSGGFSITDARLDPVMAQRRMSDGSIADNQDYSRKILRVTNA